MSDELTILDENPYRSPESLVLSPVFRAEIKYPSAIKAVLGGAWRGAKFGAKWIGLFLGGLAFILCAIVGVQLYYHVYRHGFDIRYALDAFLIICRYLFFVLTATLFTSVISSFIMAFCDGMSYWQFGGKGKTPASR
jgi:hypothetical protein